MLVNVIVKLFSDIWYNICIKYHWIAKILQAITFLNQCKIHDKASEAAVELFCVFLFLFFLYSIFLSHEHLGLFLNFPKDVLIIFFSFEFWDIYLISSIQFFSNFTIFTWTSDVTLWLLATLCNMPKGFVTYLQSKQLHLLLLHESLIGQC